MSEQNTKIDPEIVINLLNDFNSKDPEALAQLINFRVNCNEKLVQHETIQVLCESDAAGNIINPKVGLLGILNGLIGVRESGMGFIAAQVNSNTGKIIKFTKVED